MAIPVEREDLNLGGTYDEVFLFKHVCGDVDKHGNKCGGPLRVAWRDGNWWLECYRNPSHSTFEAVPSVKSRWRRGEDSTAELLWGRFPGAPSAFTEGDAAPGPAPGPIKKIDPAQAYRDLFGDDTLEMESVDLGD